MHKNQNDINLKVQLAEDSLEMRWESKRHAFTMRPIAAAKGEAKPRNFAMQ